MRIAIKTGFLMAILVWLGPVTTLRAALNDDENSITIVFKDGHQQHIRLADISRIEFSSAPAKVAMTQARFMGEWKCGNGAGGTFQITLKPNGEAQKTLGSRDGKWSVEDGEARISWQDGWHDIIRRVGNRYEKVAFSPGSSYSGEPSNVAQAVYTEAH